MIKDKITQDIKKAFLESIEKTRVTGKEQGFPICLSDKGRFFLPDKKCEGEECGLVIENVHEYCPNKIQGLFHTHPYLINVERFYGRKPSSKELESAIKLYKKHFERKGITLQTPSHHDLVDTLYDGCIGVAEGTMCVGTDLDLDKVECWALNRKKVNMLDCAQAFHEHKERISEAPREWIIPLFEKEIIELKNSKKAINKLFEALK